MMQHSALPSDRRIANHSDVLRIKRTASLADYTARLTELGALLADRLKEELPLLPGTALRQVRCLGVSVMQNAALAEQIGPLAANALHTLSGAPHCVLISASARAVLMHLDRSFGGRGDADEPLPEALPTSASFLAEGLEQTLAASLDSSFADMCGNTMGLHALSRHTRYAALSPFAPDDDLAVLTLVVDEDDSPAWQALFVLPLAALSGLFAYAAALPNSMSERSAAQHRGPASPLAAPFSDIPLPLEARLVDMTIPLSRLANLAPGFVLPIAVARQVPLRVGGRVIARGTVGEMDDTIALQITQLLSL